MTVTQISTKITEGAELSPDDLHYLHALQCGDDRDPLSPLPYLNRSYVHRLDGNADVLPHRLARYVGMVQNMLDPEYYVERCGDQSMHFRDSSLTTGETEEPDDLTGRLAERQPLLVVPVPYASEWFSSKINPKDSMTLNSGSNEDGSPRSVIIPESPPVAAANPIDNGDNDHLARKRGRDGLMSHDKPTGCNQKTKLSMPMDCDDQDSASPSSPNLLGQESDWWPAGCCQSSPPECPVLAKFYYDQYPQQHEPLRLNDVVEIIGIVSMDPFEATFPQARMDDLDLLGDPLPPPSRLPRMHVLTFRRLDIDTVATDVLELKAASCETENQLDNEVAMDSDIENSSADSKLQLWKDLCGSLSTTLAEALFLALVAKAERSPSNGQMKCAPHAALGCVSMELRCSNSHSSLLLYQKLRYFLQHVCPVVAALDGTSMLSSPAASNGRLLPNSCQLPRGATILLHLGDRPIAANTRLFLEELLGQHRIFYQFEGGMQVPFEADYRIIVITAPKPSTTASVSCTMRLELPVEGSISFPRKPCALEQLRRALHRARQSNVNIHLSKPVLDQAQEDFLQRRALARKQNQTKQQPEEADFHRWLTMTRLFARVRSSPVATLEDWQAALKLDDAMVQ